MGNTTCDLPITKKFIPVLSDFLLIDDSKSNKMKSYRRSRSTRCIKPRIAKIKNLFTNKLQLLKPLQPCMEILILSTSLAIIVIL